MCVGPCPIILNMPQVFNTCTAVLGSTTKRSFHWPSFLLHAINGIDKYLKLCLDFVNNMIVIFPRHWHGVFILAGTFKCLYLALSQDDVDLFSHYYLEAVIIMRSWLSML